MDTAPDSFRSEEWKDIPGHHGYQASSLGRIRSVERTIVVGLKGGRRAPRIFPGSILRFENKINSAGYYGVSTGRGRNEMVHRLVAKAFISNPDLKKEVNHKNGNKLDNRPENLEWCTRQENADHASSIGAFLVHARIMSRKSSGEGNPKAKLTEKDVMEIRRQLEAGALQKDLATKYGVSQAQISAIKLRKSWANI